MGKNIFGVTIPPYTEVDDTDSSEMEAFIQECLLVPSDTALLEKHLQRVSHDLAYWNQQYSLAVRDASLCELNYRKVKSLVFKAAKEEPKSTDKIAEATMNSHPSVLAAKEEFLNAEAVKNQIHGIVDGIRSKQFCLTTMFGKG